MQGRLMGWKEQAAGLCWCHWWYGLDVPATEHSTGSPDIDTCHACANRSSTACHNAHLKEGGKHRNSA